MTHITFEYLVMYAAFVDTISLSIHGHRRQRPLSIVRFGRNLPIRRVSPYARLQLGLSCRSGNPLEWKYGPSFKKQYLPPHRLRLRSEKAPLTLQEVNAITDALFRNGYTALVSAMELTFDVRLRLKFFAHHLCSPRYELVNKGTLYMGSPQSGLQVRCYQKTDDIVRFELILRRPFLRKSRLNTPEDISGLKNSDIFQQVQLRSIRTRVRIFPKRMPVSQIIGLCRARGWKEKGFVCRSAAEGVLRSMLSRMIWR